MEAFKNKAEILRRLKGGLIVSCQSDPPEPLAKPHILVAMAKAALMGGAVGIRANLPQNIRAMLKALDVPVIGIIYKKIYQNSEVFITPTLRELKALLRTGVPIIAMDATDRQRPYGQNLQDLVAYARANSSALLMADISAV
ncbi:MAG: N-acetylmannosamine-6-phosphate 2-epimerase, partial [Calditrichaeota bacterium]|nr:N-acetylmannosamine-6-phosphate 2-epimerase [Calditrichota bacterium]